MPKSPQLALSRLPRGAPTAFEVTPDAATCADLAAALDLSDLRKLRLAGDVHPEGRRDWRLEARLGATVVQPCAVTLAPVTTRIDEDILRRYTDAMPTVAEHEAEMPEDDTLEPLPATLDLMALLTEALSLAIPAFPRAPGAALGAAQFAAPGVAPMRDEDTKPLAGLAALRDRMARGAEAEDEDGDAGTDATGTARDTD